MPALRLGLDNGEVIIGYGFMVPVVPPDSGRTWSALSIPCSGCGAGVGEHCHGARFCAGRMAMIDSAELDGAVIPPRARSCPDRRKPRSQPKHERCPHLRLLSGPCCHPQISLSGRGSTHKS